MSEEVLEQVYQEALEERIIAHYASAADVSLEDAMEAYYSSVLADKIHKGTYGIQYLDFKVLAQLLREERGEL